MGRGGGGLGPTRPLDRNFVDVSCIWCRVRSVVPSFLMHGKKGGFVFQPAITLSDGLVNVFYVAMLNIWQVNLPQVCILFKRSLESPLEPKKTPFLGNPCKHSAHM